MLHIHKIVCSLKGGEGPGFEETLVNTNQSHCVSTRHVRYLLRVAAHHQHHPLNVLYAQILGTKLVTRALVPGLLPLGDGAAEAAAKRK